MNTQTFVSIIIVNFNTRECLVECLRSLQNMRYSRQSYEVIVVDNNSTDDSVHYVKNNFPEVILLENCENGGFTGGNIAGYKKARGEYIVLLNSDVCVDPEWLGELVRGARNAQTGVVCARLRYYVPFVELSIDSAVVPKSKVFHTIDHSPIGVLVEDVVCSDSKLNELVYYKSGFYDKKDGEICTRRASGKATILLPYDSTKDQIEYALTLHGFESVEPLPLRVTLAINGDQDKKIQLNSRETKQIKVSIKKKDVENSFVWLVQNAGNIVLTNGYAKDRGSVIIRHDTERREFYEQETDYFLQDRELLAACGASCLIKREVIDNVGFLDGRYFMYYEDIELSIRAFRAGWKIAYVSAAVAYHKHRASTGSEESPFFLSLVERNHLALVCTHFPLITVFREYVLFALRFGMTALKCFLFQFRDDEERSTIWKQKYEGRKDAFVVALLSLPHLLFARQQMQRYWPMSQKKLEEMLY